jgi:hypothetical protein
VSYEDVTLVMIGFLPLVVVLCLGLLVGSVINRSRRRIWPLWLVMLIVSAGLWVYYFRST